METWLKTDTELKNTLAEKRSQLQNNKVKFDLIAQINSQLLTRTTPKTNFTVGLAFFVDLYLSLMFIKNTFVYLQALLQDVMSHRRMVDSVIDKAEAIIQSTKSKDVESYVKYTKGKYETHINEAKVSLLFIG